ncbi:MAG: hypothetical protein KTR31_28260 [Myxococcales bacterium]|nr:hypothetical protein [Myxococcales bacterium]
MRPSHRLDVYLVPTDPDAAPRRSAQAYLQQLEARGILTNDGGPGPHAGRWMPEGFARLRLDLPDAPTLYANRQGGFRVRCPDRGDVVTADFARALSEWRSGGPRQFACSACGQDHPLEAADGRPAFAIGSLALVAADAGATSPTPEALAEVQQALGPVRMVLSRG